MIKLTPVLCLAILCFTLSACGSSGTDVDMSEVQDIQQGADSQSPGIGEVLSDDETEGASSQCDVDFDQAELLFTESDRQWSCSVSSTELASSDDVYFSRNGTAVFTRFGQVYWNRNLPTDEFNIASPFIASFVMREINSSNTTLQFTLDADGETGQLYDCVLVGRADLVSAL